MDTSPDASFFTLDPKSILSIRHAPLPSVGLGASPNNPTRLRQEITMVSNIHQNLSNQLGSILNKLESFSSPTLPSLSK